jgi:hypothetical protein
VPLQTAAAGGEGGRKARRRRDMCWEPHRGTPLEEEEGEGEGEIR